MTAAIYASRTQNQMTYVACWFASFWPDNLFHNWLGYQSWLAFYWETALCWMTSESIRFSFTCTHKQQHILWLFFHLICKEFLNFSVCKCCANFHLSKSLNRTWVHPTQTQMHQSTLKLYSLLLGAFHISRGHWTVGAPINHSSLLAKLHSIRNVPVNLPSPLI